MPRSEGFSASQRYDIDRAIRAAETASRFEFSVYVGSCEGEPRAYAERLHTSLGTPQRSVLIMIDPQRRVLEVVTGSVVRRDLDDDHVKLAVVAMQSALSVGDLVGAIERGLAQLSDAARAPETLHTD
ncbi:DUF5130 family protein [Nocardioides terrisoli]|uniref:DUF5130 family protein n=1 Tax=Nocardioides terrisoli TaxID=3388267 RepID=UPI00287B7C82|nr:DUF5130 family protein [Nocardioides marmorisolisilvae]